MNEIIIQILGHIFWRIRVKIFSRADQEVELMQLDVLVVLLHVV